MQWDLPGKGGVKEGANAGALLQRQQKGVGEGLRRISRPADLLPILKDDAETAVLHHIEGVVEALPKSGNPKIT